jgi:hypothetical protein
MTSIKMEMEWVDVNDKLPQDSETYVCLDPNGQIVTNLFSSVTNRWLIEPVTHWLDVKVPEIEIEICKIYEYRGVRFTIKPMANYFHIYIKETDFGFLAKEELSFKFIHKLIDNRIISLKKQCKLLDIKLADEKEQENGN